MIALGSRATNNTSSGTCNGLVRETYAKLYRPLLQGPEHANWEAAWGAARPRPVPKVIVGEIIDFDVRGLVPSSRQASEANRFLIG